MRDKDIVELTIDDCNNFVTLPQEEIILAKRQHPFMAFFSIIEVIGGSLIFFSLTSFLILTFRINISLTLLGAIFFILCFTLTIKVLIDWFYHLYIVTNRKILEVQIKPFFSDQIDDVFLDQVRTTEIDTIIQSPIHELIDMGDVTIAFDRPSHEEIYTLKNIRNPRKVALYLGNELERGMSQSPVWFHPQKPNELVKFAEDIYQKGVYL